MPTPTNRYILTDAKVTNARERYLTVTLSATGPFDYDEVLALMDGRPVAIVKAED